jgi:O-antigen ligase
LTGQEKIVDIFSYVPFVEVDTLGVRLTQYAAALDLSLSHPLFGIGGYNFTLISKAYIDSEMGIHNTFLSHLVSVGYLGTIAYAISIFTVIILTFYRAFNSSGKERLFWGAALSGLLGFQAYSFWVVMYQWHSPNAGFWVFSGIIVGAVAFDNSPLFEIS